MTKEAIASSAEKVTYAGAAGSFFGSMTSNDIAMYGGLLIAFGTFLVNLWFRWQHFKLAKAAVEGGKAQVIIDESGDGN